MPQSLINPHRGTGLALNAPDVIASAQAVSALLAECPMHSETPLRVCPALADQVGVAQVFVKDESARMGLGSFKALGASFAIAREAAAAVQNGAWASALNGRIYVTASAGNHGLSVAAGAGVFGARAVIYLAHTVPEAFAQRLRDKGADVVRAGAQYEASMDAALQAAQDHGWTLLSDSSWTGYTDLPRRVMEGYGQMTFEITKAMDHAPSHIVLQAGVGGLAGAVAAQARAVWGDGPTIIVVEPEAAPALIDSIRAGRMMDTTGPVSDMGRLDCKTPSLLALQSLSRDADLFVTITETEAHDGVAHLAQHGLATTPSGGAGLAALLAGLDLPTDARVLAILSEGPETGASDA